MKILILTLLLAAPACGRDNQARILELLRQFKADAADHGLSVNLSRVRVGLVGGFREKTLGQCNFNTQGVELLASWWRRASDICQEQLLYHELGHCVLGRNHLNSRRGPQGFPTSIMKKSIFRCSVYGLYRDYYLRELFR